MVDALSHYSKPIVLKGLKAFIFELHSLSHENQRFLGGPVFAWDVSGSGRFGPGRTSRSRRRSRGRRHIPRLPLSSRDNSLSRQRSVENWWLRLLRLRLGRLNDS
jgi:hypothetical protein